MLISTPLQQLVARGWFQVILCILSGLLHFLAVPNLNLWLISWFGTVPLLIAIVHTSPRRAFLYAALTSLVGNLGAYSWVVGLLMRFGHFPWAAAFSLYLLLSAYHALQWGLLGYGVCRCRKAFPKLPLAVTAPLFLVSGELITPMIFDGSVAITQAWVVPIIQIADLTGPYGVTFLLTMVNGALFELGYAAVYRKRLPWRSPVGAAVVLLLALGYGAIRIAQTEEVRSSAPRTKIGVVQGNISVVQLRRSDLADRHHRLHLEVSRGLQDRGAELIIWPESAYSYTIDRARETDFEDYDRRKIMRGFDVPLIFGVETYGRKERFPYNSAYMIDGEGRIVGRFDKNHLLVFGEYVPFYETVPQLKKWFPAMYHLNRGTEIAVFPFGEHRIGPLICYEDTIPTFTRRLARLKPNLLINLTNDAWFGLSAAPHQHLALSVLRSVELRLELVRAVNTGVSAFVDATGRVRAKTELYDPMVQGEVGAVTLLEEVALMPSSSTVYAAVGDLFAYLNLFAAFGLLIAARRRRRKTRSYG